MKALSNPIKRALRVALVLPFVGLVLYLVRNTRYIAGALREGISPGNILRALVPRHPIPMRTIFRECFLVNFSVDPAVLRRHLPVGIEPDLYAGKSWLSIVIAHMDRMRPAFLPPNFGVTYDQIVYRAVVRYRNERGVYFLRSDANNFFMSLAGDLLTFFRFHHSPSHFEVKNHQVRCDLTTPPGEQAGIHATYNLLSATHSMPSSSLFADLPEAQRFLVELFVAFGTIPPAPDVLKVRIKRGEWHISVVDDLRGQYQFMQDSPLFPPGSAQLNSIFYVKELPYYWHTLERS